MSVVKVTVTHSTRSTVVPEKRLGLTQSIEQVKRALSSHFATPPEHMRLALRSDKGVQVADDMQDEKLLGYYGCKDDYTIHVVDLQPQTAAAHVENFDDVSKVEKFTISEEAYSKRTDNVRAFKEKMIDQQKAELLQQGIVPAEALHDDSYKEAAAHIHVGNRAKCSPGDRLGTVRYVGRVEGLRPGYWVGVEFDEPVGKGDGTAKARRYFECRPLYGSFLRPDQLEVGDFPAEEF